MELSIFPFRLRGSSTRNGPERPGGRLKGDSRPSGAVFRPAMKLAGERFVRAVRFFGKRAEGRSADGLDPFGRPLFLDPGALSRVGVVDVGSNSVRLVVFDGAARSPAYFYNEKVMAGLGAGVAETGRLNIDGKRRAKAAIRRFQTIAQGMKISPLMAVATAAMRSAKDGPAFRDEIERDTGLDLRVLDGAEEARLSAQGVLLGWPDADGLVCDIGGSSMELAEVDAGRVGTCLTSPLGPLQLQAVMGGKSGRRKRIRKIAAKLASELGERHGCLYLVGGSWRAIARLDMLRRDYPLRVLHEYRMTPKSIAATLNWVKKGNPSGMRPPAGISESRMSLVPLAGEVLREMIATFKPGEIAISGYGIREGMLYERMPEELRRRDPLIEACRFAEAKDARMPGFGKRLLEFVSPLFRKAPESRLRVIEAACLLHDVTWRAHPDYRHEACFDNVTRASLGGLTHPERVFLGLALLHRYRNSREGTRFQPLFGLLKAEDIRQAEVLGKAMRFGAMLSADRAECMGKLDWRPKSKKLTLRLAPRTQELFGEVARARFDSLAAALGAERQEALHP